MAEMRVQLRKQILQDVKRTNQENEIFKEEENQKMLSNVLFIYAKKNNVLSYKQGMNELVAVIFCVFHSAKKEYSGLKKCEKLDFMMKGDYLEHDVYIAFRGLMSKMACFFEDREKVSKKSSEENSKENSDPSTLLPISIQCNFIHHTLLRKYDLPLYQHLTRYQVLPEVYMLRWVRLLFIREISPKFISHAWDAIFAYGGDDELVLVDFIVLGILQILRQTRFYHFFPFFSLHALRFL